MTLCMDDALEDDNGVKQRNGMQMEALMRYQ
jgi:hypothetical protein